MENHSFTAINQHLLELLPELLPSLQGERFHYLKIAQHAAVYHFMGSSQKLIAHRFNKSFFWQHHIYSLKAFRAKNHLRPALNELVLIDSGRAAPLADGQAVSVYFQHIKEQVSSPLSHLIALNGNNEIAHDLDLKSQLVLMQKSLHPEEVRLLKDINSVLKQLKKQPQVSADFWEYLASAFHRFFEEFHLYFQLFKNQKIKKVVATNHYHQEGLIAACRMNKIKFFELQHGLMSKCDIYYAYPEQVLPSIDLREAFFADTLFLYGEFWKGILRQGGEQKNTQLEVAGDYVYKQLQSQDEQPELVKKNVIFIGAQKNMHLEYVAYLKQLLPLVEEKHPDWIVQVKLHPLEKKADLYYALEHPQLDIRWNESDLSTLLREAKIQISVYSTTLYDALGFDVLNLSIQNYTAYKDYAAEMIDMKIAFPLDFDADPIALLDEFHITELTPRERVYSTFDPNVFKNRLDHD
ncbi:MAG: hypothetical protein P8N19_01920 [Flavobacteriales bacterium]|nr:hypothetical protein [Flavobacteriales bacterium]